ncbi:cytochrome b-c1 complex subunit 8 [Nomascus leucogenys]|uniref:Cytochrome b-c1 complex subunit 8 n=1 Tax=Nomascus leucogenys TaxID=61853 RepID=G1RQV7_NOMLE|nr:cytochrome b-c1 complex subunit 8 [Nomascus leucogenys]XP_032012333.1 cytochrome b-c1 complex subunit 8 [Hylobates moloch]XP_055155486.1 cytochrome b-c1 complex subunit 8 [Symphalangus syndactylus]
MGREFGNLTRMRHVISYSLSPFEQRVYPHVFTKGIPNVLRRIRESFFRVVPQFVVFYLIYTWGTEEFEKSKRKNPAAYENDK